MFQMELSKGAKKIIEVCANVKKGERVLIVTDNGRSLRIAEALAAAAAAVGGEVSVIITSPGKKPGEEPNAVVAAAMAAADLIIAPTTRTIYHSMAAKRAVEKGARLITLTEITEESMISGGIEADYPLLKPLVDFVERKFNSGKRVHITAPGGTDLCVDITGRTSVPCSGICHEPGTKIGLPEVEVFIAPVEDKTNGRLVVDASCSGIGLVEQPITLTIKDGRVVSIEGGREARKLQSILDSTNDPASYVIAEFALGLNDKAKVIGNIIEDEGVYGTGHFAVGNNVYFGGKNEASIHIDMVYWKPTVEVDGEVIMKDGKLNM